MRKMSTRLMPATNIKLGRNILINPDNSSMRLVSYGRIRLADTHDKVAFANEGQETGLICLNGECRVSVAGRSFDLKRDDALYIPKSLPIKVESSSEAD